MTPPAMATATSGARWRRLLPRFQEPLEAAPVLLLLTPATRAMTGVSSRYSPRGLPTHDQPVRVPFATGWKRRAPTMSAAGMWIDDASRLGRS
jgi:hypothetical protein